MSETKDRTPTPTPELYRVVTKNLPCKLWLLAKPEEERSNWKTQGCMIEHTQLASSKLLTLAGEHNTKSCSVKTQAEKGSDDSRGYTSAYSKCNGKALETLESGYTVMVIRLVF